MTRLDDEIEINRLYNCYSDAVNQRDWPLYRDCWTDDAVWDWGPYDYRNDESRDIDPELGIGEIYQSVFRDGYYYNVSPIYPDGDHTHEQTGLLRGEYELDEKNPNLLNVHFTSYRGIQGRPANETPIWTLAPKAEAETLENEIAIVPWLVVQLFFGTGSLDEVYTDSELRITYGSNGSDDAKKAIYIMTKVK